MKSIRYLLAAALFLAPSVSMARDISVDKEQIDEYGKQLAFTLKLLERNIGESASKASVRINLYRAFDDMNGKIDTAYSLLRTSGKKLIVDDEKFFRAAESVDRSVTNFQAEVRAAKLQKGEHVEMSKHMTDAQAYTVAIASIIQRASYGTLPPSSPSYETPIPLGEYEKLRTAVYNARAKDRVHNLVASAALTYFFSASQIVGLMRLNGAEDVKYDIALTLYPRVTDRNAWHTVYAELSTPYAQRLAAAIGDNPVQAPPAGMSKQEKELKIDGYVADPKDDVCIENGRFFCMADGRGSKQISAICVNNVVWKKDCKASSSWTTCGVSGQCESTGQNNDGHASRPVAMSDSDFNDFLSAYKKESFQSNRKRLVESVAQHQYFLTSQVIAIVRSSTFSEEQNHAAITLYPRVIDLSNWYQVYSAVTYSSSKDVIQKSVANLPTAPQLYGQAPNNNYVPMPQYDAKSLAMSEKDFDSLLGAYRQEPFSDDQMRILRSASTNAYFNVSQVVRLIKATNSNQANVAITLYPRVVDAGNWYKVYSALTFSSDKSKIERAIQNMTPAGN